MQKARYSYESVAAAGVAARSRLRIGSAEHKELFCRTFIDTHTSYEPGDLPWPALDTESLALLRAVPVWTLALEVEVNAGTMLEQFAATQRDPLIAQALALQGYEEARHGRMLETLIDRYGLTAASPRPPARPSRGEFIVFGYNECLDSFLGFGIFRLAREAHIVSEQLIALFERILVEEARHIVFFVNWIAYDRIQRGLRLPLSHVIPTAFGYVNALKKTLGRARGKSEEKGIAAAGEVFKNLTLRSFLKTCLQENERYMAAFDSRLLRPRVIPAIARAALEISNTFTFTRSQPR